jgi:membrane associated rhomboid family serine protease
MFPLRTDRRLRRTPWVTHALILINVLVYAGQHVGTPDALGMLWWEPYVLDPQNPRWYQFVTYAFLHDYSSPLHLGFNMLFLFVFGESVEDRLRPWGYIVFYLLGAVASGGAHCLTTLNPVLGASGAISAVTGAFLALFPKTRVTVLFFFILIAFIQVPSMYLIVFFFLKDVLLQTTADGRVSHAAHIGGTVYGFGVGMGLLATGILSREQYDFLSLLKHWNRRRRFRALADGGSAPWASDAKAQMDGQMSEAETQVALLRSKVSEALRSSDDLAAVLAYERLLDADSEQVMARDQQEDLANRAIRQEKYETAAVAYRRLLETYSTDTRTDETRLMLALVLQRYLHRSAEAIPHLQQIASSMSDPTHQQLARDLLAEAEKGTGKTDDGGRGRYKF